MCNHSNIRFAKYLICLLTFAHEQRTEKLCVGGLNSPPGTTFSFTFLTKPFYHTLIVTLTEFGRTIVQNSGYGIKHVYGTAFLLGGGLLKKSQVFTD